VPDNFGLLLEAVALERFSPLEPIVVAAERVAHQREVEAASLLGLPYVGQLMDKEALAAYDKGISSGKLTSGQVGKAYATARNNAAQDAGVLSAAASAASKSKRGEDALRVGEDYWGYGRYADAETMARAALAKGVKDTGEANMLLGASLVAQGKTAEAQTTFAKVSGNAVRSRAAHLWSLYAQVKAKGTSASQ